MPAGRRGAGFAEHVAAMRACWGPDPVEFQGDHYRIPPSLVGPKPRAGTVPLFIGAVTRPAIERAARIGDGFVTVALPGGWEDTPEPYRRMSGQPLMTCARITAERIGARLHHVPGHYPHVQHPEVVNAVLGEFRDAAA